MKKNSEKLQKTKESLSSNGGLVEDISTVLVRHGHENFRLRSFGLETLDDDCGGRPKVPVKVRGPNGEAITIWVCP